ncbi:MAG: hypothetical protein Q8N59_02220 [bacterium]|nr:hypothetical protein [bacterium]
MKRKFYNLLSIITLVILLVGVFRVAAAQNPTTLINYPTIAGQTVAFGMPLPQLIKYIYLFAVGICGAVALAAILLGAIKYIGAAGNPSKMGDAKDQIVSALLGVVILLSSYLLLYTINPDLVNIGIVLPDIDTSALNKGTALYYCVCQYSWFFNLYFYNKPLEDMRGRYTNYDNIIRREWGSARCMRLDAAKAWYGCQRACTGIARTDNFRAFIIGAIGNAVNFDNVRYKNSVIWRCEQ